MIRRGGLENDPKTEVPKSIRPCGAGAVLVGRAGKSAERLRGQVHSAVRGSLGRRGYTRAQRVQCSIRSLARLGGQSRFPSVPEPAGAPMAEVRARLAHDLNLGGRVAVRKTDSTRSNTSRDKEGGTDGKDLTYSGVPRRYSSGPAQRIDACFGGRRW